MITRRVGRALKSVIPSRVDHEVLVNGNALNVSKKIFFRADYVLVGSISIFRLIRKIQDKG